MSFNSKYTGAQVQELLGKIPTANDIWHKGNLTKLSQLENDSAFITTSQLNSYSPYYASTARTLVDSQGGKSVVYVSGIRFYIGDSIYPTTQTHILGNSIHLRYGEEATTGLILNSSGNVGIGTTNPGYKFHVEGTMYGDLKMKTPRTIWGQSFDGTSNIKGNIYVINEDATTIGENSGKIKFNSININTTNTDKDGLRSPYIQAIYQSNYSRKRLSIFQSNAANYTDDFVEVFTILPNGNTGIGIVSPAYKLDVNGNIHTSGTLTQDSDIRLKDINKDILLSIEDIANAPLFEFTYKSDEDKRIHVGTSAQYWIERNNWFCKKQNNGYYDMEIQNLALASAISIAKEFKKYKEETESTIDNMKKEIEELKQIILNMNK